ncbi:hypothetical protein LCGC14_1721930 [marine sediment metagenome]|uniref:Uncharacterized protein n=1 Tax=marine sediment metagenome TaxID=412755 RepID=A0A0F9JSK9_9ZZZZ
MWPDIVNGIFELFGAPFICLSILYLHKQKSVKGVSWIHVFFFTMWGYWNLFYYPHLEQWYSFFGGIAIVIANTIWLYQLLYYLNMNRTRKENHETTQH